MLPADAQSPGLIVFERTGEWQAALRRELPGQPLDPVRSLADLHAALSASPASFVVLDLASTEPARALARLAAWRLQFRLARFAACGRCDQRALGPAVIEAGGLGLVVAKREAGRLARWVRAHLAIAPVAPVSLAEQVWSRLPWAAAGASAGQVD